MRNSVQKIKTDENGVCGKPLTPSGGGGSGAGSPEKILNLRCFLLHFGAYEVQFAQELLVIFETVAMCFP